MRRRPLVAFFVVVASVLSPLARGASADSTTDKQKLDRIAAQLAQMQLQSSLLDEQFLQAQSDATRAQADVAATEARVVELQQQLGVIQSQVSELALQQFANGDAGGGLGALLGDPSKLTNSVERDQATKVAFSDGQDSVDQLGAGVDALNKQKATLAKQQQIAQNKTAIVAAKQDDLTKRTATLTKLQADTEALYGKDQVAEAEAAQQKLLDEQQARQVQAAAAAAQAQAAKDQAAAAKAAGDRAAAEQATAKAAQAAAASAAAQTAANRGAANNAPAPAPAAPTKGGGTGAGSTSGDTGGGGGAGGSTDPTPAPDPPPVAAPPPAPGAATAVQAALSQLGVPYVFASASPGHAFDCSGLTMWAWSQAGVSLPHQSRAQYAMLPRVSQSDIQPGDLLFFNNPIHHVAMYIGNGQMVEAPASGLTVRLRAVNWSTVVGIGRP